MAINGKKILRKTLKILMWLTLSIFILLLLIIILIRIPAVQNFVTQKAVTYLSGKIKSKVELKSILISFPKKIHLQGLYIEDRSKDTLLYVYDLTVDIALTDLLRNKLTLNSVAADHLTGHVRRLYPDTTFNYSFILQAFASADTVPKPVDTSSSSMKIFIGKISLESIYLTYKDTLSGIDAKVRLGQLKTSIRDLDLDKMSFRVKNFLLERSSIALIQTKPLDTIPSEDTTSKPLTVLLDELKLSGIILKYRSYADSIDAGIKIGGIELKNTRYEGDSVRLDRLQIKGTEMTYDKTGTKETPSGIDFNHLAVTGFSFDGKDIAASSAGISVKLDHFSLREKSGFILKDFTTKLSYGNTHVELANLDLQTQNSRIRSHLAASYPSLKTISDSMEKVKIKVVLDRATLSMKDVLYFMPQLSQDQSFKRYNNEKINVSGQADGTLKDLVLREFDLQAGAVTRIRIDGRVMNVMKTDQIYADLHLREFTTARNDIVALVPTDMLPKDVNIPSFIEAEGSFKGTMKDFSGILDLRSSDGGATASVKMHPVAGPAKSGYSGVVSLKGLDPGKLLNQKDLGPVTLTLTFNGQGLDTATVAAHIDLKVEQAVFQGYDYHDLAVKGDLNKMAFDGEAAMNDSNLIFSYKGITDLNSKNGKFNFVLYLKGADLKALNFSEKENKVSGTVSADLQLTPQGNLLGKASLARIMVIEGEKKITIDSIKYSASQQQDITHLNLQIPGFELSAKGKIVMKETGASFSRMLNHYYTFSNAPDTAKLQPQHFDFSLKMNDPELFEKLVPSLERLTPFQLTGNFNSQAGRFSLKGDIPQIIYSGMSIDTLSLDMATEADKLNYAIAGKSVFNSSLKMENFNLSGNLAQNAIIFRLSSERPDSGTMIAISGKVDHQGEATRVVLDPPLTLANTNWNIAAGNSIVFGKNGMIITGIKLSNGEQLLSVSSKGNNNPPLEITFKDFEIGNFSKIIEKDTALVRGILDGNFTMINDTAAPGFTSDLTISRFAFMSVPVGDISLKASSTEQNAYTINLGITGQGNDLRLSGKYMSGKEDRLDMMIDVHNIEMKTMQPFTFGQITDMTGNLAGSIKVTGSTKAPGLDGDLTFNKVKLRPKTVGTLLSMDGDKLLFQGGKIRFDNFTIADSLNNKAIINGFADYSDLSQLAFDITLKTRNFTAMNTSKKPKETVYGKVLLDSDIHLTGTQQKPVVDMTVKLNNGTDVTFVNPEKQAGLVESEGIVIYTDSISRQNPIMTREDSLAMGKAAVTEMDLKATISFDENAMLKMMVDPVSGDSLFVKGSGDMAFTLDPSGTMSLTGRYIIKDGGYHLTVSGLLKRDFRIRRGSTISWNGDLMEAEANIVALYDVETSPLTLLEDQMNGASDQQKNKYRNTLKFEVLLEIAGVIKKPEIHFDIELQEKDRGAMGGAVYSKLQELREDESQLNKQVFSLLTLGRFMGQDPLESGNAPLTVSSAARSSASKLLTDQLNNLSAKYVKGVDLDVGVKSYEDYSAGQPEGRTQLQLGISKQMLQGRLTVRVGSNIDVEGEKATQNNLSDIAGDISAEYKLTDDGRYRLKGFRQTEFENPIEGELTKTGIGFIFTRDFNKIKEMYQKQNNLVPLDEK